MWELLLLPLISALPCQNSTVQVEYRFDLVLNVSKSCQLLLSSSSSTLLIAQTRQTRARNGSSFVSQTEYQVARSRNSRFFVEVAPGRDLRVLMTVAEECRGGTNMNLFFCSNLQVCIPRELACNGVNECGEDELGCSLIDLIQAGRSVGRRARGDERPRLEHLEINEDEQGFSSSFFMFIGFSLLNGSFIVFFLVLSLCSVSSVMVRCLYTAKNKKSRQTFARYIREASQRSAIFHDQREDDIPRLLQNIFQQEVLAEGGDDDGQNELVETSLTPPTRRLSRARPSPPPVHRPSILSRINFEPSPILKELKEQEPETEDDSGLVSTLFASPEVSSVKELMTDYRRARKFSMPTISLHEAPPVNWHTTSLKASRRRSLWTLH